MGLKPSPQAGGGLGQLHSAGGGAIAERGIKIQFSIPYSSSTSGSDFLMIAAIQSILLRV